MLDMPTNRLINLRLLGRKDITDVLES